MTIAPKSGGLLALLALAAFTSACEEKSEPEDGDRDGYTLEEGDCNDGNVDVHPGAMELCNNSDDDCDSSVDEDAGDATEYFIDYDQDGFGSDTYTEYACDPPPGYVTNANDCADDDPDVHPDAEELCNGTDEDCDEVIDEGAYDPVTWYIDYDGDGYGSTD